MDTHNLIRKHGGQGRIVVLRDRSVVTGNRQKMEAICVATDRRTGKQDVGLSPQGNIIQP